MATSDMNMNIPYSFYYKKSTIVLGISTASISAVSSFIILSIIFRTKSQLSTTYHRIITWLCIADICTSISIALSTVPMPKDMPYPFEMPSYGNQTTCTVQGMIYLIGNAFVFWFNGMLNTYYLCSLGLNMDEKKIRRYMEIPLLLFGIACCIGIPTAQVSNTINPGPLDPYCASYVPPCEDGSEECDEDGRAGYDEAYLATLCTGFITLMVCMSYITFVFYRNKWKLKQANENTKEDEEVGSQMNAEAAEEIQHRMETLKHAQETARTITIQAFMYILAFNCVWVFGFLEYLLELGIFNENNSTRDTLAILRMIFQPSQGTFNMLIFIYHKVHNLRKSDEDIPYYEALVITIFRPDLLEEDSQIISNFNLVVEDFYAANTKQKMLQLEMHREGPSDDSVMFSGKDSDSRRGEVDLASIGNFDDSSKRMPSAPHISSLAGFSTNLDNDVDENSEPNVLASAATVERQNASNTGNDDNDISYAQETNFTDDDHLSFKSFFSRKKKEDPNE